jgi:hypothetical protein
MEKKQITLPDGRYLIFYTFPEYDPPHDMPASEDQQPSNSDAGSDEPEDPAS